MDVGSLPILGFGGAIAAAMLSIVLGLANCFFGYRIFRLMLAVYGFVLGSLLAFRLVESLLGEPRWMLLFAGLLGGLVGAGLLSVLYVVGVFGLGALAGAWLAGFVGWSLGLPAPFWVIVLAAAAMGIAALIFQYPAIVLVTAFGGAWLAVGGVVSLLTGWGMGLARPFRHLTGLPQSGWPALIALGLWLVLGVLGSVTQFRATKR